MIAVCHISLRNFGLLGPKVTKTKLAWKELEEQLCILIARLALETHSFPLPEPKTEAVKIIWGLRTANTAFIALVFDEVLPCFPPAVGHSHKLIRITTQLPPDKTFDTDMEMSSQGGRTWQPFVGGKNGHEIFVKRIFANFATNAPFLRVITNLRI